MKNDFKVKARIRGDFNAPWMDVIYRRMKGFYYKIVKGKKSDKKIQYRTLRKTVTINFHKWKSRKKSLNKSLKERKITLWTEFWWAKFWRKGKTLRKLAMELKDVTNLPNYQISNKDRSNQIINALDQAEKHYTQYDELFINTDPMLAYGIDEFNLFKKKHKAKEIIRDIPRRFISYFKP